MVIVRYWICGGAGGCSPGIVSPFRLPDKQETAGTRVLRVDRRPDTTIAVIGDRKADWALADWICQLVSIKPNWNPLSVCPLKDSDEVDIVGDNAPNTIAALRAITGQRYDECARAWMVMIDRPRVRIDVHANYDCLNG
jgi:hypothetical protein